MQPMNATTHSFVFDELSNCTQTISDANASSINVAVVATSTKSYFEAIATGIILVYVSLSAVFNFFAWAAWRAAMRRMEKLEQNPSPWVKKRGWTLIHRAPSFWSFEKWLKILVHYPFNVLALVRTLCYYVPRDLLRKLVFQQKITDQHVWDLATTTMLMLCCEVDAEGETVVYRGVSSSKPIYRTTKAPFVDGSSLVVVMRSGKIISASTSAGPVEDCGDISRNDIVFDAMMLALSVWIHPATHLSAEKAAGEIAHKKIHALAASCLFTHALHEGLLHSPLSPANGMPVLRSSIPSIEDWLPVVLIMPPHKLHLIKGNLRYFSFYMRAHAVLRRLLRKHEIDVDVNNLFSALILHSLDHQACVDVCDTIPARLAGCSTSPWLLNLIENTVYTHMWCKPPWNPAYSELICDAQGPFYAELFAELGKVDLELAKRIWCSCSF